MGMGQAACRKSTEADARVIVTDCARDDAAMTNLQARAVHAR